MSIVTFCSTHRHSIGLFAENMADRLRLRAVVELRRTGVRIDIINAHASSTQLNDSAETKSIRHVFGEQANRVPVSGTKGYYAHPLGATGAIEAALCALALDRQW